MDLEAKVLSRDRNAAQLILSILLLKSGQTDVLKISIIGSILSNLLLMMGLGVLAGTYNRSQLYFNIVQGQTQGSMLLMIAGSLLIAAVFVNTYPAVDISVCYALAIILLVFYASVLLFVFKSHRLSLSEESPRVEVRRNRNTAIPSAKIRLMFVQSGLAIMGSGAPLAAETAHNTTNDKTEENGEKPQLSPLMTIAALAVMTALVTFHTEFVSSGISNFMGAANVSPTFTGIVLLPFLSNDAITITAAAKGQLDVSFAYTFGKCAQIGLAIFPFCVVLGWIIGVPLIWDFGLSDVALLCTAVLIVHRIVASSRVVW
jgi:Ca2+:H+ antiporter